MVNKVILLGRLGSDPEMKHSQSQTAICNFKLATNERKKGADGQWGDHTEWHNVVCFGKTAENVNTYLAKGKQAFIEGKIQTRKYEGKDGNTKYFTEIVANSVQFLGSGSESKPQEGTFTKKESAKVVDDFDSDLPF